MKINTDMLVSMTEANQNFSKVTRLVEEKGSVIILKNNVPRYLLIDFQRADSAYGENLSDAEVESISKSLIAENMEAYRKLAK